MKKIVEFLLTILLMFSLSEKLCAQEKEFYTLDKKIQVPGDGGYDYLSINDVDRRLYVSHGVSVNVIDLILWRYLSDQRCAVHAIPAHV